MIAVLRMTQLLLTAAPRAMARGAALAIVVLLMGAALLGLSGWFITATGIAGLAGIGVGFDVFRPSAGVRFLALGRTAARYGERLWTHDATLRALAALRVTLLRGLAQRNGRGLTALRGEAALTRITADVDALDGLVLRLALPALAALITHLVSFALLWWLTGLGPAVTVLLGTLPLAALILWRLARRAQKPSAAAEDAAQALRRATIDLIRDREAVILSGKLGSRQTALTALDDQARRASKALDQADRHTAAALALLAATVTASAFVAGAWALDQSALDPARAVIAAFVTLALAEALLPLRRGFGDLGRMAGAAARITLPTQTPARPALTDPTVSVNRPEVTLSLTTGETVALVGASGSGKTTLLHAIAGLDPLEGVTLGGRAPLDWDETSLRAQVTLLPQRSALIAGTVRDNLTLAAAKPDAALWQALDAVQLAAALRARQGLDTPLFEAGAGLSGGQARRLTLARSLLKSPKLLLLDEPTEGLDSATAQAVLTGIRSALPTATILIALHRGTHHPIFDRTIWLRLPV